MTCSTKKYSAQGHCADEVFSGRGKEAVEVRKRNGWEVNLLAFQIKTCSYQQSISITNTYFSLEFIKSRVKN